MAGSSIAARLFRQLLKLGVVYVVLQIVVGVETGLLIVYLNMAEGMPLGVAMATAIPIGLPLLLAQGALYLLYQSGLVGRLWRKWARGTDEPVDEPADEP